MKTNEERAKIRAKILQKCNRGSVMTSDTRDSGDMDGGSKNEEGNDTSVKPKKSRKRSKKQKSETAELIHGEEESKDVNKKQINMTEETHQQSIEEDPFFMG